MRLSGATTAVLLVLVGGTWGLLNVAWYPHHQITDYGVYQDYGDRMVNRLEVPYRDFRPEYPPAALPVFAAPALFDDYGYRRVFRILMFLCDAALVVAVGAIGGLVPGALAAVAPLALGSVVISRFDLWPAFLAVAALLLLLRSRRSSSAIVLATGFAAKLWPGVLAPLFVIWVARRHGPRAAGRWLVTALAAAAAWFLPFAAIAPGGIAHAFHAQLARPLQLESLGASILLVVHDATGSSLRMVGSFGSQNVTGSGVHAVEVATSVLAVVALLVVWVGFARSTASADGLLVSCAAAVAALLAFGKVFSPQFMIWLIPFVPLVRGVRGLAASAFLYAALVLTQTWFPAHYWDLALHFAPTQTAEVYVRNLCVVALFVVLAWPVLEDQVLRKHGSRLEPLERVRA